MLPIVTHQSTYTNTPALSPYLCLSEATTPPVLPPGAHGARSPVSLGTVGTFTRTSPLTHRLQWTAHSCRASHLLAESLSTALLSTVPDLSRGYLAPSRWRGQPTHSIALLPYGQVHSLTPLHCTLDLTQKSRYQNEIKSKAAQPHSSSLTPVTYFISLIVHPWLYMFVGSHLRLRQLAGQLQRRWCQVCLGYASVSICLMPRPAKSPTSGFHCTLPA